jgi:hypothetical protein
VPIEEEEGDFLFKSCRLYAEKYGTARQVTDDKMVLALCMRDN